eukprot:1263290-Pyramimonas_sp.AAC.1
MASQVSTAMARKSNALGYKSFATHVKLIYLYRHPCDTRLCVCRQAGTPRRTERVVTFLTPITRGEREYTQSAGRSREERGDILRARANRLVCTVL